MPIHIAWDNEQQNTLYMALQGRWHWNDLDAALRTTYLMIDQRRDATLSVDLILDLRGSQMTMPRGLPPEETRLAHHSIGVTLFVGSDASARQFWALFLRVYHPRVSSKTFLFAPTLDSARLTLAEYHRRVER